MQAFDRSTPRPKARARGVDLTKVAGGKTYSQISAQWIVGGMKNTTLAGERTTLFMAQGA
jgi:hypothetical protein